MKAAASLAMRGLVSGCSDIYLVGGADIVCVGQDPQYTMPPAWAKKEGEENAIPVTESHTGEGTPANADGKAPDANEEAPAGQTAPARQ